MLDSPLKATTTHEGLPSTRSGDFPSYVDSTILTTYRACKRKHLWSTILALYPTGRSVHLVAGGAFAAGMEAARTRVFTDPEPSQVTHLQMLEAAYPAFLREWGDFRPPENHAKSFVNTFCAIDYYLTEFPPTRDPLQPYIRPDGSPAVEYRFAVPLEECLHPVTGEPILFVGRFDMIAMYLAGHASIPCIQDEKTTYSMSVGWADSWDLRGQFIGYIWSLRQQGLNLSHAAIRGVAIQKTGFKIQTALPQYTDHIIDRWHKQMIRDINNMISIYKFWQENKATLGFDLDGELYSYNFGDSCSSYGGCAYTTLCLAKDPEPFFTNYIRHRWNPIAKQPVEELPNA